MAIRKPHQRVFYNYLLLLTIAFSYQLSLVAIVSGTAKESYRYTSDPCGATVHGKKVTFLDQEADYRAGACDQLSPDVVVAWTLEEADIRFEVHAYTEGWVAIGVNNIASLFGADMALGWVNDNGKGYIAVSIVLW